MYAIPYGSSGLELARALAPQLETSTAACPSVDAAGAGEAPISELGSSQALRLLSAPESKGALALQRPRCPAGEPKDESIRCDELPADAFRFGQQHRSVSRVESTLAFDALLEHQIDGAASNVAEVLRARRDAGEFRRKWVLAAEYVTPGIEDGRPHCTRGVRFAAFASSAELEATLAEWTESSWDVASARVFSPERPTGGVVWDRYSRGKAESRPFAALPPEQRDTLDPSRWTVAWMEPPFALQYSQVASAAAARQLLLDHVSLLRAAVYAPGI